MSYISLETTFKDCTKTQDSFISIMFKKNALVDHPKETDHRLNSSLDRVDRVKGIKLEEVVDLENYTSQNGPGFVMAIN